MANSMAALCFLAVVMTLVTVPAHAQTSQCNTTLLQAVAADPNLAELAKLISASNLANTLNMTDNVTVLAPNNEAFNGTTGLYTRLRQANVSLEQLTGQAENSDNRAGSVVLYHILQGPAMTAAMLTNGRTYPTALSGYSLSVVKSNTVTFIGNATNSTVLTADARVCNSIVHVVNRVLLPSGNLTAIPVYDDDAPAPGVGGSGASGLSIGAWAFALSGALAAALMM